MVSSQVVHSHNHRMGKVGRDQGGSTGSSVNIEKFKHLINLDVKSFLKLKNSLYSLNNV